MRAENLDGQGVEELVGEDDERNVGRERATNIRGRLALLGGTDECVRPYVSFAGTNMLAQGFLQLGLQGRRGLLQGCLLYTSRCV